jgi:hypothetical protein
MIGSILEVARTVLKGRTNVGLISFLLSTIGGLVSYVERIRSSGGEMSLEDINLFWQGFDRRTGIEGVIHVLPSIPVEDEEKLLDGVKAIGTVLMKWAFGHYGSVPDLADIQGLRKDLTAPMVAVAPDPDKDLEAAGPDPDKDLEAAGPDPDKDLEAAGPDLWDVLKRSIEAPGAFLMADRVRALTEAVLILRENLSAPETA